MEKFGFQPQKVILLKVWPRGGRGGGSHSAPPLNRLPFTGTSCLEHSDQQHRPCARRPAGPQLGRPASCRSARRRAAQHHRPRAAVAAMAWPGPRRLGRCPDPQRPPVLHAGRAVILDYARSLFCCPYTCRDSPQYYERQRGEEHWQHGHRGCLFGLGRGELPQQPGRRGRRRGLHENRAIILPHSIPVHTENPYSRGWPRGMAARPSFQPRHRITESPRALTRRPYARRVSPGRGLCIGKLVISMCNLVI